MKINTDGIIIKRGTVGEGTRLVTVLTRDLGLIRGFVHGASKSKGKAVSGTDMLCYSSFTVTRNKDTYTFSEFTPIEVFFDLREDIESLSLAQYFCEVAMNLSVEGENSQEPLRVLLNCLYMLMKKVRPPVQIKAIYELRQMSLAGFMPDLSCCSKCGKDSKGAVWFDYAEGTISCESCGGNGSFIPYGVLAAMRHITNCDIEKLFSFELSEQSLKVLGGVAERYLITHCDRDFTALKFYKSL